MSQPVVFDTTYNVVEYNKLTALTNGPSYSNALMKYAFERGFAGKSRTLTTAEREDIIRILRTPTSQKTANDEAFEEEVIKLSDNLMDADSTSNLDEANKALQAFTARVGELELEYTRPEFLDGVFALLKKYGADTKAGVFETAPNYSGLVDDLGDAIA